MTFPVEEPTPGRDNDPRYHRQDGIYVPANKGVTKWFSGDVYTMKATGKATGGLLGFIEATVPPGGGPPPHAHPSSGEAFYVLSGEVEFLNGNRTIEASVGDFLFVPPGARHGFKNIGIHTAKMIFLFSPAGFDEVFVQAGLEPRPGEQPPPWGPDDVERMLEVGRSLDDGTELLL